MTQLQLSSIDLANIITNRAYKKDIFLSKVHLQKTLIFLLAKLNQHHNYKPLVKYVFKTDVIYNGIHGPYFKNVSSIYSDHINALPITPNMFDTPFTSSDPLINHYIDLLLEHQPYILMELSKEHPSFKNHKTQINYNDLKHYSV